jgi:WD40 repeat protein
VDFHSFGFMGTDDGTPASGALTAVDAGGWFVADGDARFRRFIEEGLSGAPVYANGVALGMVTQRLEREVKQGLVIPAFALAQAWPPLAEPYPGLPAFDAATAHLYFGRGRPPRAGDPPTGQLKQLVQRLEAQRLVGLMGASGSGKSSLAKAGVAPLYEQRGWVVLGFRPGLNPLQNLAETLATELDKAPPGPERVNAIERWVPRLEAGNLTVALNAIRAMGAVGTLIVVDQFEEFFTADPARDSEIARQRGVLLPQLLAAALDRTDVRCLLTGRLDLIERIVTNDKVAARMLADPLPPYMLSAMAMNEVSEAVARPAEVFGVTVDPALIGELAAETTQAEGRLPLLQAALRHAWSGLRRTGNNWRVDRPDLPFGTGLLDGAVRVQADMAAEALKRGLSERPGIAEEDLCRVLLSLVRLEGGTAMRRLLLRTETERADWVILEALAEHRLVTLSGAEGTAELVHEAVMTAWPLLVDLIASHVNFLLWRTRFDRDFLTWKDCGCADEYLLRRQDVAIALDWLESKQCDLPSPTVTEAAFITASRDHHDRRTRELEALLAQAQEAEVAANEARNTALLQEARALAAFAQQESARGDHMTAVLLALEGLPEPGHGGERPLSAEAAAALRQAWVRNREICLAGHGGPVHTAAFSTDRYRVVTASADGTARVWDLSGPRPIPTVLEGHTGPVNAASFSADGNHVVTASADGSARVWDLSGPRLIPTVLEGHSGPVNAASFSADGNHVVTASADGSARVWDLSGPRPIPTVLEGHSSPVNAASFGTDGRRVVTASRDTTARVWDLSGPYPAATVLEGHTGPVYAASFNTDGRRILTVSADGSARVWDLSGPRPIPTVLEGHSGPVNAASFSADGRHVVTASADGTARVWDLFGSRPVPTVLEGHGDWVLAAAFSADGHHVVTVSADGTVRVWDLSRPRLTATVLVGHAGPVSTAEFSADGRCVVTASADGTARIWELSGPHPAAVLEGHTGPVNAAAFSADGRRVITACTDNTARVWDLSESRPTAAVLVGHMSWVNAAAFSANGRCIVTASDDCTARVWNLSASRSVPTVLEAHTGPVLAVALSVDGRRVVTASADDTARVWDLSDPHLVATVLEGHADWVRGVALSADGHLVVTASDDGMARVWDLSDPHLVAIVLEGHAGPVLAAAFSADGRRILTASDDRTVRIWNLSDRYSDVTVLEGHTGPVYAASFSADGRRILTASTDGTARVWDLSGPRPIPTVLEGHTGPVLAAAFSADGRRILTASTDCTVRVWDAYPDIVELSALVIARLSRRLSTAQRERFGLAVEDKARARTFIPPPDIEEHYPQ